MTQEPDNVYCQLDVLLDTRMGVIAQMDPDAITRVTENGYHTRLEDRFEGIDQGEWKRRYANRDVSTLMNSLLSNGIGLLKSILLQIKKDSLRRPYTIGGKLVINTYPYALDDEALVILKACLEEWLPPELAEIEFIHLSDEGLTPTYCKSAGFSVMVMYEYNTWMNLQTEAFRSMDGKKLSDIILFAPMIHFVEKPTEEELKKLDVESPFMAVEMLASPLIGLQLIDVEWFSLYNGKTH